MGTFASCGFRPGSRRWRSADDWDPPSLGTGREIRAALDACPPGIICTEDGWGDYEGPGFSLSTPVKEADDALVTGVGLVIHGGGEAAAHAALAVSDRLNARAVATGTDGFLTADSARSAFGAWRAYRDRIVSGGETA
ncbi:hypothetical protein [Streptomyces rimosus]|uniref:hypothetical protein n=1 Tax=Streptomyces rimosus TaxID=1927 RepID=UPI000A4A73CB|nr:hypothetical protein [Streptomyces rimosus]